MECPVCGIKCAVENNLACHMFAHHLQPATSIENGYCWCGDFVWTAQYFLLHCQARDDGVLSHFLACKLGVDQ